MAFMMLKKIYKLITKDKIYNHVRIIKEFYKLNFNQNPVIAITGLNPHCESNMKNSEENKIIIPAINKLKKTSQKYMVLYLLIVFL